MSSHLNTAILFEEFQIWRVKSKPGYTYAEQQRRNIINAGSKKSCYLHPIQQGFPTFLWPCTPSAFRHMSMYP